MTIRYRSLYMLLLCLCCIENGHCWSRLQVIEKARSLCNERKLCETNNTGNGTIKYTSTCCSDCSCDKKCEEYGNCFFPDGAYPLGDSYEGKGERRVEENKATLIFKCFYPSSPQPDDDSARAEQQSFWMISEIVKGPKLLGNQTCGQRKVASWGSVLPVSSKKTGLIYKNVLCAKDHGVKEEDVVVWEGQNVCAGRLARYFELSETYLDRCQKRFYAPSGIAIKTSSLCYNALIDTCQEKAFDSPSFVNMSNAEVINACISGFVSPYRYRGMFANIFCSICNDAGITVSRCSYMNVFLAGYAGRGSGYLTGLIDYSYLQSLSRDQGEVAKPSNAKFA